MKLGQVESGLRFDASAELFITSAQVREVSNKMPAKFKRGDEVLLDIAREHAPDPSVFDQHAPVFIPSRISTTELDAYFTRMHISTLRNYAKEAAEGRAFLEGHIISRLPLGFSLTGDLDEVGEEEAAVYSYAYVVPGRIVTDDFILAYKTASVRDISVGFGGGTHICSICNNDIWDYEKCRHWPGCWYKVDEEPAVEGTSRAATEILCFAWVKDAHLREYSAVYEGATPSAVILKAQRQIEAGQMDARTVQMLNQRYRSLNLPLLNQALTVPVGFNLKEEKRSMANENNGHKPETQPTDDILRTATQEARTAAFAEVREAICAPLADLLTEEERKLDVVPQLRLLVGKVNNEHLMAELGRKARQTAIDEAIKEGVRALGEEFKETEQRQLLGNLSASGDLTMVETMRTNWAALADNVLPKGRQSKDQADRATETEQAGPALPLPASTWG